MRSANHYNLKKSSNKEKFNNTSSYKLNNNYKNDKNDYNSNKNNDDENDKFMGISAHDIKKKIVANDEDNFQNVMDELDNVDLDAFSFNSIGNTIKRYSDNLTNRIDNAAKQNPYSPLDKTMAQGHVLFDEFKKLFILKDVF